VVDDVTQFAPRDTQQAIWLTGMLLNRVAYAECHYRLLAWPSWRRAANRLWGQLRGTAPEMLSLRQAEARGHTTTRIDGARLELTPGEEGLEIWNSEALEDANSRLETVHRCIGLVHHCVNSFTQWLAQKFEDPEVRILDFAQRVDRLAFPIDTAELARGVYEDPSSDRPDRSYSVGHPAWAQEQAWPDDVQSAWNDNFPSPPPAPAFASGDGTDLPSRAAAVAELHQAAFSLLAGAAPPADRHGIRVSASDRSIEREGLGRVTLTPTLFNLFTALYRSGNGVGRLTSERTLLGSRGGTTTRTLQKRISRLRKEIEPLGLAIQSRRQEGAYQLDVEPDGQQGV
jgi:hypothetical protein